MRDYSRFIGFVTIKSHSWGTVISMSYYLGVILPCYSNVQMCHKIVIIDSGKNYDR